MELAFTCPECGEKNRIGPAEKGTVLTCARCTYVGVLDSAWSRKGRVACCPICGSQKLFRRREYQGNVVLVALILGTVFALLTRFVSLLIALGVTAIHCLRAPEKLVCYRCTAEVRGHAPRGQFPPYDPSVAAEVARNRESGQGQSNSPRSLQ